MGGEGIDQSKEMDEDGDEDDEDKAEVMKPHEEPYCRKIVGRKQSLLMQ